MTTKLFLLFFWLMLFSCTSKQVPAGFSNIIFTTSAPVVPVIKGINHNPLIRLAVNVPQGPDFIRIRKLRVNMSKEASDELESISIFSNGAEKAFNAEKPFSTTKIRASSMEIPVNVTLAAGENYIWISAKLKNNAPLDGRIAVIARELVDDDGRKYRVTGIGEAEAGFTKRKAVALRKGGEKNVHTYRIPGMITTSTGVIVAVYDIRNDTSTDLPGNIDVGMSRSMDGGSTWEQMNVIMDMGRPHKENGIGDPCVLYDPYTNKIFVSALWSKGDRSIRGSGPGLTPDETGQFMITESSDDGVSWSKPRSITAEVKEPLWKIFFQGPGTGIVMNDGTLVFPAQYWDELGVPYATIIYSKDKGQSWRRGSGAKANTTESQVVESSKGVLMLNMRDDQGKFRSVMVTNDMGMNWQEHPSSRNALVDPVCMASFIKADMNWKGAMKDILFFSNPASSTRRDHITIRASEDMGATWKAYHSLLIDERPGYGYSSLTRIDKNTIGLLYEGKGDLYFIRIPIAEFFH